MTLVRFTSIQGGHHVAHPNEDFLREGFAALGRGDMDPWCQCQSRLVQPIRWRVFSVEHPEASGQLSVLTPAQRSRASHGADQTGTGYARDDLERPGGTGS